MSRLIITITILLFTTTNISAQTKNSKTGINEYGVIDTADLKITSCDFEKDANAMVLFESQKSYYSKSLPLTVITEYHKRIKIFNNNAKDLANVSLKYYTGNFDKISKLEAETFNLKAGKIEITKLDAHLIYNTKIDKNAAELVFSMPDVREGSVIEYKYVYETGIYDYFPNWYTRSTLPIRLSRIKSSVSYRLPAKVWKENKKDTVRKIDLTAQQFFNRNAITYEYSVSNSPSLPIEPYMRSYADALEDATCKPGTRVFVPFSKDNENITKSLINSDDFGKQFDKKLKDEDSILNVVFSLKTEYEKVAYLFNKVKNSMKWNGNDAWYINDGLSKAWQSKTGNSTEINLILFNLLTKSGISACPFLTSTRENGNVNNYNIKITDFNRTVVLIPLNADSSNYYLLDATDKYNTLNVIPFELLNSKGLCLDVFHKNCRLFTIVNTEPVKKIVLIDAFLTADGKLNADLIINDYGNNKLKSIKFYKKDGEKVFSDSLKNGNNDFLVSDLKLENMDVDTLPLTQYFKLNINISAIDQNYIYFKPCLFNPLNHNPFLKDVRETDVDFGYKNNFTIRGSYKIPVGYTLEAIPKAMRLTMPDNSIVFNRIAAEHDGLIVVNFAIAFQKSIFLKSEYSALHDFYKKMFEMLNEPIVLKKI